MYGWRLSAHHHDITHEDHSGTLPSYDIIIIIIINSSSSSVAAAATSNKDQNNVAKGGIAD